MKDKKLLCENTTFDSAIVLDLDSCLYGEKLVFISCLPNGEVKLISKEGHLYVFNIKQLKLNLCS